MSAPAGRTDVRVRLPEPIARASLEGLARYDGFDGAAREKIERANALSLLPRLAARLGAAS